ncbi:MULTISPECIES: hypothetical protein [Halorubrum]|uniref:Uncharacterized protein n=2 Tax=Halorubrum TaxID=56688 RepID=A0A8T4GG25_9EURY|nr:hypothetical protein [Halorubrum alkaliphilum]MBP1923093.1 hypothetical protein [Halorubrum alkaliphilum]
MKRREYLGCVSIMSVTMLSGCSGLDAEESGTVRAPDDALHNIDVEQGQTIRVEIDNREGFATDVILEDPGGNDVFNEIVETEGSFTHTAEQSGVFRVIIFPDGTASYEIYIED